MAEERIEDSGDANCKTQHKSVHAALRNDGY
ncbi:uncharacterized protein G2W53_009286 [Senna tora]|uniref:Uncharacterized protein n=1 Tax=Senna tora TaxID=362788 RepID=A0A834WXT5_9FABA|nr:uncharacterized protein G2W53_009286 [Senna tora]